MIQRARIACFASAVMAFSVGTASAQLTLQIKDYLTMPVTGLVDGKVGNSVLLSRVNSIKEEPGGATRLFIPDQNGPLYILDKETKKLTTYLDFNGRDTRPGMFHRLSYEQGYGVGLNCFVFDPDYRRNGKFYTVHMEESAMAGSSVPDNKNFPGLNATGYTPTPAIGSPGPAIIEGVIVEWTDTDISNSTFEGRAREILRVQLTGKAHPMGEIIFNPTAKPGDPDWRVMYIGQGDSASGESNTPFRSNPQRLDTLLGKILRIIPDLNEHTSTSTVSDNGRYRIPNDNPFVSKPAGARKEIWAYGFRNPHRLSWAVDPTNPSNNRLIANSIGLHTWETINIVHKGANYGYSQREGNEVVKDNNQTGPLPALDKILVYVHDTPTEELVVPVYPVAQYGHDEGGGDAIGTGYLYQGKAIPALQGKYVFTDITTGHIFYTDYKEMLAADDGKPSTMAQIHQLKISWKNPDTADAGERVYDSMFPIAEAAYHARGGKDPDLPGAAKVSGTGRADTRIAIDAAGEMYIHTKTDGVIRQVVGAK